MGNLYVHDPGYDFGTITPNDNTDLKPHRALWVSAEGEVVIMSKSGGTVSLGTLQPGTLIPVVVKRVMAATTATVLRIK
jgi:hypothetical protein